MRVPWPRTPALTGPIAEEQLPVLLNSWLFWQLFVEVPPAEREREVSIMEDIKDLHRLKSISWCGKILQIWECLQGYVRQGTVAGPL